MSQSLSHLTHSLLDAAKTAGAEDADAIAIDATSVSIDERGGELEHAERSEGADIGLRVLLGKRQACVSASDIRPDAMAREAPEDASIGLASPDELAKSWNLEPLEMADPSPEPSPQQLQEDARRAEAAALEMDGISQVDVAAAGYSRHALHIAASNGFSGGYQRTSNGIYCVAITGTGTDMERDYFSESLTFRSDLPSPEEVGRIAAERTIARAGARKPPTGSFPVLYDERISASLIGHLLAAINGSAIVRGSSWARDLLHKQVLPARLSLIEDPHRARAARSKPFDAEGLATAKRAIVDAGNLSGWTLDLATARKLGMTSTANASRGASSPPNPSIGNVELTQGASSPADLMRDMGTGLLVTSLIGTSINPTTGDYSRGASGFWIEDGEIAYPVNECTIAGNLRDMLLSVIPANDAKRHRSHIVPSLLVEGLTLAGE